MAVDNCTPFGQAICSYPGRPNDSIVVSFTCKGRPGCPKIRTVLTNQSHGFQNQAETAEIMRKCAFPMSGHIVDTVTLCVVDSSDAMFSRAGFPLIWEEAKYGKQGNGSLS